VRILAVGLAHDNQQFAEGSPPKGAWLFLQPDLECARLASLVPAEDEFAYADLRTEAVEHLPAADLTLVSVGFGHETLARQVAARAAETGRPVVFFGPVPTTTWGQSPPEWCRHHVAGDIVNVWSELTQDARGGRLRPHYAAGGGPAHVPIRPGLGRWPLMNSRHQRMSFVRGCSCPDSVRGLCSEYLYHGRDLVPRSREEVCGEVLTLPGKHIQLLDDDVARLPDYYLDVFRRLWNYRRHWTVNAGTGLFRRPELIDLLAKAGTRTVFLNESFVSDRLAEVMADERLRRSLFRRVKLLQSRRILAGARLTLELRPDSRTDFTRVARTLQLLDLDFLEARFVSDEPGSGRRWVPVCYRPKMEPADPAMARVRFYSWSAILNRLVRRPRRVGFYTTALYLLRYSLAYRQNLLEGIPYP